MPILISSRKRTAIGTPGLRANGKRENGDAMAYAPETTSQDVFQSNPPMPVSTIDTIQRHTFEKTKNGGKIRLPFDHITKKEIKGRKKDERDGCGIKFVYD